MNRQNNISCFFVVCFFLLVSAAGCVTTSNSAAAGSMLYQKAERLYRAGHYSAAKEYFHEYIANYPDEDLYEVSLYYLGHCYQKLEDKKEALSLYNRVIHKYSDDDFWVQAAKKRIEEIN